MSKINYNVYGIQPKSIGEYEDYSSTDRQLLDSFEIVSNFDPLSNNIELHIYSKDGERLKSINPFNNFSFLQTSEIATGKAYTVTLDPAKDAVDNGYLYGGVQLLYNFTDNLYTDTKNPIKFILKEISGDRTEIKLKAVGLEDEVVTGITSTILDNLNSSSDFNDFRINLGNNDLLIGINIDVRVENDETFVIVKLYESLPDIYEVNNLLEIQNLTSDSAAYEIFSEVIPDEITVPKLKGPNFNIDIGEEISNTSDYLSTENIFSFPVTNSYRELNALAKQKNIELSIDYSDFSNFVHFSSAEERIENFKYKLDSIATYQNNYDLFDNANTNAGQFITGSRSYYENLINNIIENFDHYDRFLYFGSGSHSWPKENSDYPYVNVASTATEAVTWYQDKIASASLYDSNNGNSLRSSIPLFLRDDPSNESYNIFVDMIGQHFDNIWIYADAITKKYDTDNRLDYGISKELIDEVLKNFGVKLYSSNKSTQDLFKMFTGELYNTGSEDIETFVTASDLPISELNYRKQVYKRIYHNLPLLLKSKGTERGLRVLMNCFGIPNLNTSGSHTGLQVTYYGGQETKLSYDILGSVEEGVDYGPTDTVTSSIDKVRLDNTGSSIPDDSLSEYVSTTKFTRIYTDDIPSVDIGYSPSDPVNRYIKSQLPNFNLDKYIGDPSLAFSSSYTTMASASNALEYSISGSDLQDLTRILKFYDNVIFKMVKDFVPARTNVSSGIIIKPHLLNRSKAKLVQASSKQSTHLSGSYRTNISSSFSQVKKQLTGDITITGSLQVGSIESTDGGTFGGRSQISSSYSASLMTSGGLAHYPYYLDESPRYDGELSGSGITVNGKNLNQTNEFKYAIPTYLTFNQTFVSSLIDCTVDFEINDPSIANGINQVDITASNIGVNAGEEFTIHFDDPSCGKLKNSVTESSDPGQIRIVTSASLSTGIEIDFPENARNAYVKINTSASNLTGRDEFCMQCFGPVVITGSVTADPIDPIPVTPPITPTATITPTGTVPSKTQITKAVRIVEVDVDESTPDFCSIYAYLFLNNANGAFVTASLGSVGGTTSLQLYAAADKSLLYSFGEGTKAVLISEIDTANPDNPDTYYRANTGSLGTLAERVECDN